MPRFSVIIPVYNVASYLGACLQSIAAAVERYGERTQVICIDDGSTDGSGAMLDAFRWRTPLVEPLVIHQPNAGVSAARNAGLAAATGEYICFVDADDWVDEEWLECYAKAVKSHSPDIVRQYMGDSPVVDRHVDESELHDWCWDAFVKNGYPWAYTVKREIAMNELFPVGVEMGEDALYAAKLVAHITRVFQLGTRNYRHMVRKDSAMFKRLSSRERFAYLESLLDIAENSPDVNLVRLSRMCCDCILQWAARPADIRYKKEIREVWKRLRSIGCARCSAVGQLFRLPIRIYAVTGWIWPMRVWNKCVVALARFKKLVLQKCK